MGYTLDVSSISSRLLRKRLMDKLHLPRDLVTLAMLSGMLDLLCVIPRDKVKGKGMAYVCSKLEKGKDSRKEMKKWNKFWLYFRRQWIPLLDRRNIYYKDGEYLDMVNHTNNGIERYNRRFNAIFPPKPTLITFVTTVEIKSRYQASRLDDVWTGKLRVESREEQSIPSIPTDYDSYILL